MHKIGFGFFEEKGTVGNYEKKTRECYIKFQHRLDDYEYVNKNNYLY